MKKTLLASLATLLFAGYANAQKIDNSVVKTLDLNRYLGDWYEIARFDHKFERGIEYCKANYALREDGKIAVTNTGIKNGQPKTSNGKAKKTDTPALLRVSFFGPFYSDYRVMMLDPDYQWALVGSKSADYLWILSRTPKLPKATLDTILAEARRRGYDTSKLIWVKQK
ncbi:MAG: outer membrane lipoprotein Blc [bacterium P3]|nr:MAG: outer membrane lipoprotein Blc [bacterium P3]KWW34149.1 MAG: outer membrane lipoprotein Blc [bacterium F083]